MRVLLISESKFPTNLLLPFIFNTISKTLDPF
jgi:hypothetical protein